MRETAVAVDPRVVDTREYVAHSPVDNENAPPDRGEQFGPHRRGMGVDQPDAANKWCAVARLEGADVGMHELGSCL
jgi:hypothetical protein